MADYRPDEKAFAPALKSAAMHKALIDICYDEGIPFAKAISPDAEPLLEGYIDSFYVDGAHTQRISGWSRAACRIVNDSNHASAVEYGWDLAHNQWTDHPGYHVLAMTADHLGGII